MSERAHLQRAWNYQGFPDYTIRLEGTTYWNEVDWDPSKVQPHDPLTPAFQHDTLYSQA